MGTLLKLRDYQRSTLDAVAASWEGGTRRPAVVLPTGAGKTVVFAHLAKEHLDAAPAGRVLILVHTDELVQQAYRKVRSVAPHLPVGIVKATRNEIRARVIVASVQTLRSERRRNQISGVTLIIVDECHHATAPTYRAILAHYGTLASEDRPESGSTRVVGFTATLARGDKSKLSEVWQDVAYRKDIGFMVRRRYLVPPRGKRIIVDDLELSKVKRSGGDYQASSLGEALEASLAPEVIAKAYVEHAHDRAGILFAPTVDSAYACAEALADQGVTAEVIHGALPREQRRAIVKRLDAGATQVVCNCMVLTEGFDSPRVSCVVVARPTQSSPLYQQMVGRGLRVDPDRPYEEQDCLILDVVGASQGHTLASLVDLSERDIQYRDDATLEELEDEYDLALEELGESGGGITLDAPGWHTGPVKAVDFDPLASASKAAWKRSIGGTWFLTAGTGVAGAYVFLVDSNEADAPIGSHDVVWATLAPGYLRGGKRGEVTEHRGLDLEAAFAWAEDVAAEIAVDSPLNTLAKGASWRKASAPSQAQRDLARRLGITVPDGCKKGELSDLIDIQIASSRVDPIVKALRG